MKVDEVEEHLTLESLFKIPRSSKRDLLPLSSWKRWKWETFRRRAYWTRRDVAVFGFKAMGLDS